LAEIADVIDAANALEDAQKSVASLDAEEARLTARLAEIRKTRAQQEADLSERKRTLKDAVGAVL